MEARDGTGEKYKAKKEKLKELTGNVRDENERDEGGKGSARVELRAVKELDYENQDHRRGFRFRVQVTDKVSYRICLYYFHYK